MENSLNSSPAARSEESGSFRHGWIQELISLCSSALLSLHCSVLRLHVDASRDVCSGATFPLAPVCAEQEGPALQHSLSRCQISQMASDKETANFITWLAGKMSKLQPSFPTAPLTLPVLVDGASCVDEWVPPLPVFMHAAPASLWGSSDYTVQYQGSQRPASEFFRWNPVPTDSSQIFPQMHLLESKSAEPSMWAPWLRSEKQGSSQHRVCLIDLLLIGCLPRWSRRSFWFGYSLTTHFLPRLGGERAGTRHSQP